MIVVLSHGNIREVNMRVGGECLCIVPKDVGRVAQVHFAINYGFLCQEKNNNNFITCTLFSKAAFVLTR